MTLLRARRVALAAAVAAGVAVSLTGCIAAPIFDGILQNRYERVVPRQSDPPFIPMPPPTESGDPSEPAPEPTQPGPAVPGPTGDAGGA